MKKVYSLALIELTALYDILGTEFKQQKAVKIKTKGKMVFCILNQLHLFNPMKQMLLLLYDLPAENLCIIYKQ